LIRDIPARDRLVELRCYRRSRRGEFVGVVRANVEVGGWWLPGGWVLRAALPDPSEDTWRLRCKDCAAGHPVDPTKVRALLDHHRGRVKNAVDVLRVASE
jgi:hypothetical protein